MVAIYRFKLWDSLSAYLLIKWSSVKLDLFRNDSFISEFYPCSTFIIIITICDWIHWRCYWLSSKSIKCYFVCNLKVHVMCRLLALIKVCLSIVRQTWKEASPATYLARIYIIGNPKEKLVVLRQYSRRKSFWSIRNVQILDRCDWSLGYRLVIAEINSYCFDVIWLLF